jgi:hypothetical protein
MPSPRALLGVAPALIVVAGSLALARHHERESPSDEALARQPLSERVSFPTADDEARLHRVALKQETADDLLDGRLTLAEAVERFETYSSAPEALANLRGSLGGRTDRERSVNQVLAFVRVRAAQEPARYRPALERIEADARAFVAVAVAALMD